MLLAERVCRRGHPPPLGMDHHGIFLSLLNEMESVEDTPTFPLSLFGLHVLSCNLECHQERLQVRRPSVTPPTHASARTHAREHAARNQVQCVTRCDEVAAGGVTGVGGGEG